MRRNECDYCIGLGFYASVLDEDNVFGGVKNPINTTSYSNSSSVAMSRSNLYASTSGSTSNRGSGVFTPPYGYSPESASSVQADVQANAGPK